MLISAKSMRQRVKLLEESIRKLQEEMEPLQTMLKDGERVLGLEFLSQDLEIYLGWKKDKADYLEKQQEQKNLRERLEQLKSQNVAAWEEERASIVELCKRREKVLEQVKEQRNRSEWAGENEKRTLVNLEKTLTEKERNHVEQPEFDAEFQELLEQKQASGAVIRYDLQWRISEKAGKGRRRAGERNAEAAGAPECLSAHLSSPQFSVGSREQRGISEAAG
ncbi:MAG: hypothetical protein ACLUD2_05445 [Clostridium sp.]